MQTCENSLKFNQGINCNMQPIEEEFDTDEKTLS